MTTSNETILGYLTISADREESIPQEFAGSVVRVTVHAGRYPIVLARSRYNTTYIVARCSATQTYSGWFGSNTRVDRTPKPTTWNWTPRGYELANLVLAGSKAEEKVELVDGVEVGVHAYMSERREGDEGYVPCARFLGELRMGGRRIETSI